MEALLMAINNFIPSDVGFWGTNKREPVGNKSNEARWFSHAEGEMKTRCVDVERAPPDGKS